MQTHEISPLAWERMVAAVEKVRARLRRVAQALEQAGIPYAVAGGNAVAAWVSEVDEAAVRNTQDIDLLLRRADLERTKEALAAAGFEFRNLSGLDLFLDGPGAKARDAVHLVYAMEKVRPDNAEPAPDVVDSIATATARVVSLDALVRMKLTSFRDKDRTLLRDLIGVGLVDSQWLPKLPQPLSARLEEILANPDG